MERPRKESPSNYGSDEVCGMSWGCAGFILWWMGFMEIAGMIVGIIMAAQVRSKVTPIVITGCAIGIGGTAAAGISLVLGKFVTTFKICIPTKIVTAIFMYIGTGLDPRFIPGTIPIGNWMVMTLIMVCCCFSKRIQRHTD